VFSELELVVLTRDRPDRGLRAGDVGTVVGEGRGGRGYRVEFASPGGAGAGVVQVPARHLRPVRPREIFHVRTVGPIPSA